MGIGSNEVDDKIQEKESERSIKPKDCCTQIQP